MICAILYPYNYIILFSRTANQSPYRHCLRIGIGRPPQKGDVINWVLGRPCSEDADKIRTATDKALEVLEIFAKKGLEAAVRATRS